MSFLSSEPPKPPESGKKSRWDVSEQRDDKKSDYSQSELLNAAQNQTETKPGQGSAPEAPASSRSADTTPANKAKVCEQKRVLNRVRVIS